MRVALYARVSTEEQALHGLSIDAQLATLHEAFPNGEEYVDLGISARKPITKRPELQRLLRDVEADKIDLICFVKLDRWTRNIREYYKCQDILDAHNVAWKALKEDYETQTASGRLKVNIMLAVAQDEADRTSERIKAVFDRKREQGLVATGSVPLGVKIEDGHYVADDAKLVQELFDFFIRSRSAQKTAKLYGYTGNGIRKVIKNRVYKDIGIIEPGVWQTAQDILKERSQRHVRSDRVYLFSGLIFCPHCGSRLSCVCTYGHVYYRCPRHYDGDCPGSYVKEEKVEQYLLSQLIPEMEEINITIKQKQKKSVNVSDLKKKRDKLTDLYMNDLISKEKYAEDFKAIQNAIEEAERQPKPIDTKEVKNILQAYKTLSRAGKKAFWSTALKKVVPTEDGFIFDLNYT